MTTLYAEFSAFAAEFKAARPERFGRRSERAKRSEAPFRGVPARLDVDAARAELRELVARHDARYEYSDDYSVWARGQAEAQRIADLRSAIAKAGAAA
jgi:hypothetical protein